MERNGYRRFSEFVALPPLGVLIGIPFSTREFHPP